MKRELHRHSPGRFTSAAVAGCMAVAFASASWAGTDKNLLPHLVSKEGRHALIVDGAPFLMLGAQCHNSSAWPAMLPKVWPAIEYLHANTLEIPVYWEQFEPEPGKIRHLGRGQLLKQAREHHVRLVLLWFGTWKNGSSHYMPLWMKSQPDKCPRIIGKNGRRVDSPSPHAPAMLAARHPRLQRAHAPPEGGGSPAHGHHGAGRKRAWAPGTRVRDFSPEAAETLHGAGPGGTVEGDGRPMRRRRQLAAKSSAPTPTSIFTPGPSRISSARSLRPARRSIRCRCTSTPRCATR